MAHVHGGVGHHNGTHTNDWLRIRCGHCGQIVTAAVVASYGVTRYLLCPDCGLGSVTTSRQTDVAEPLYPSSAFGPTIEGLPPDVKKAYNEARRCLSVNSPSACELLCRKILMHVAVDKGAAEGASFVSYLDHLESAGYITPPMRGWADIIRQNGNESTHTLTEVSKERAQGRLMFTAELLRLIYEMEYLKNIYSSDGYSQ